MQVWVQVRLDVINRWETMTLFAPHSSRVSASANSKASLSRMKEEMTPLKQEALWGDQ